MIKGDKFLLNIYEYKTIDHIPNNKELEDLGNDGWELCSILNLDMSNKIVYYFKRKCGELMTIKACEII
jgi:hypothetical protein